jgi:hypothetical protein
LYILQRVAKEFLLWQDVCIEIWQYGKLPRERVAKLAGQQVGTETVGLDVALRWLVWTACFIKLLGTGANIKLRNNQNKLVLTGFKPSLANFKEC